MEKYLPLVLLVSCLTVAACSTNTGQGTGTGARISGRCSRPMRRLGIFSAV